MAIFNEAFIGDIIVLNEKKTHEEYAKEKFKKKYNFVPDKPGSSNGFDEDDYLKDSKKEDQDRRDKDFEKAKKFEKPENPHLRAEEFEADRYAANRTSERAVKKSLANYNKISKKDSKLSKDVKSDVAQEDFKQRSKALKDKDLRDAKTYK